MRHRHRAERDRNLDLHASAGPATLRFLICRMTRRDTPAASWAARHRLAQLAVTIVVLLALGAMTLPQAAAHPSPVAHPRNSAPGETPADGDAHRAPPPVAIQIAAAGVNGPVETRGIIDGELAAPTGPWVVAWYLQTARPGETGNVVMAGHVDYWDTGPAIFFGLGNLRPGAVIEVTDAAGTAYGYAVAWVRTYPMAELTPDQLQEIVGPTEAPSLTLITCDGPFDESRGEYLSRLVVRASRLDR